MHAPRGAVWGSNMICSELEKLEAQLDDIISELEKPDLASWQREELESAYARLSQTIAAHQKSGHNGAPCFEE